MLRAEGIHKVYRNGAEALQVLKGIDLEVKRGEIAVIVGPSGAGKSTLLHILGGLDEPTEGRVWLDDVDLYRLSDTARATIRNTRIGFVFQFYHLLPEFSVWENVCFPYWLSASRRGKGDERKGHQARAVAEGLLGKVGLTGRLHHRPSELSGGEQQRVAIARALINRPEVILCDEPTGNLDSATGQAIRSLLWEISRKEQATLVIVTHDQGMAQDADRVIHLQDGRII